LLVEAGVLATVGGAVGFAIALWATRVIAPPSGAVAPGNMWGSIGEFARPRVDLGLLAFAAGVTILTALLCGIAPALTGSRASLATALRQGGTSTRGAARLSFRNAAVAVEVALALILLIGGSLMLATLAKLRGESLGIDPRNVIAFAVRPPEVRYSTQTAPAFIERLLSSIERVPGVTAATVDGCARLDVVAPAHVAHHHQVGPRLEMRRVIALPRLHAPLSQPLSHGWVEGGVAACHAIAGLPQQTRQGAHSSPCDAD
jgi:hypothetical protein